MKIEKRFPATVSMDIMTFLNDKKVDAEFYAVLQEYSFPQENNGEKRTIVRKKDLPTQIEIAKKLEIKSPKTIRAHRDYLIDRGFIIDEGDYYILPNAEEVFLMIPLETLQFLSDTIKEQVIKIYLYLGQRWKYKKDSWVFTKEELINHIGFKQDDKIGRRVNNALDCLQDLGLIDYIEFFEKDGRGNPVPKMRLTAFSFYTNKQRSKLKG